ncbi:MAG: GNAT family N-acetyltransferase [Melioribacteraceae bacterium]
MNIILRKTTDEDLETLFLYQTDEESNQMAAFTSENPNDRNAYFDKWLKIIINPKINMQTIIHDNLIVGSVLHFDMMSETNVSYWIGRKHWGNGIATMALKLFIEQVNKRPLFGRVAYDNFGSQKVLVNCGFKTIGEEYGFANAREKEIKEFLYKLEK